ncbi:MAG: hypothetical protein AAGG46_03740 [Planctomycetota bacterium]
MPMLVAFPLHGGEGFGEDVERPGPLKNRVGRWGGIRRLIVFGGVEALQVLRAPLGGRFVAVPRDGESIEGREQERAKPALVRIGDRQQLLVEHLEHELLDQVLSGLDRHAFELQVQEHRLLVSPEQFPHVLA